NLRLKRLGPPMTENPPMSAVVTLKSLFPCLKKFEISNDWSLVFDETYERLLIDGDQLSLNAKTVLESWAKLLPGNDDRRQILIDATPFLIGVFDSEKTIRLYSPRLSQELF